MLFSKMPTSRTSFDMDYADPSPTIGELCAGKDQNQLVAEFQEFFNQSTEAPSPKVVGVKRVQKGDSEEFVVTIEYGGSRHTLVVEGQSDPFSWFETNELPFAPGSSEENPEQWEKWTKQEVHFPWGHRQHGGSAPPKLSSVLRRIAAKIDASENPDRSLVAADLKKILAAIDPQAG